MRKHHSSSYTRKLSNRYTRTRSNAGTSSVFRQGLRPYVHKGHVVFYALVGRESTTFDHELQQNVKTRLLTGVKDGHGDIVADHVWVKDYDEPAWVEEGLEISFSAVVVPYVRQRAGKDIIELGLGNVRDLCLHEELDDGL